jgi:hypothetical protein
MSNKYIIVLTVLLAASVPFAHGADIVTNPGFETGDLSGWTLSGADSSPQDNGIYYGVDATDAYSGAFGAYFGPIGGVLTLQQTLSTSPGSGYSLTFWLSQSVNTPPGYVNSFSVVFAGTTLYSQTNLPASSFSESTFDVTASSNSSLLAFNFRNDTGFFSLDDISVAPASVVVPEPATEILLILGLVYVIALRRSNACRC